MIEHSGHIELVLSKDKREHISNKEYLYDDWAVRDASVKKEQLLEYYKNTINDINTSLQNDGINLYVLKQIAVLRDKERDVNNYMRILENKNSRGESKRIKLDIVDASFNFRRLKMKTLVNNLSDGEELCN